MPNAEPAPTERLQKVLAAAGVGSRRACEDLIFRRRVMVNGRVAQLGDKVDPATAEIYVNGERVVIDTRLVYLAMNKPRGVVSTMDDEKGRTALADFLDTVQQRVYHVGRLDADSEGLLLLTNDGTLAHRLTHPSFGVPKTYLCEVAGPLPRSVGRQLLAGVELSDGFARVDGFKLVDSFGRTAQIEITLHEGRNHIVRRLMDEVGHPVSRLVRTAIGPIRLGDLRVGRVRRLNNAEVAALFRAAVSSDDAAEPRGDAALRPSRGDGAARPSRGDASGRPVRGDGGARSSRGGGAGRSSRADGAARSSRGDGGARSSRGGAARRP